MNGVIAAPYFIPGKLAPLPLQHIIGIMCCQTGMVTANRSQTGVAIPLVRADSVDLAPLRIPSGVLIRTRNDHFVMESSPIPMISRNGGSCA